MFNIKNNASILSIEPVSTGDLKRWLRYIKKLQRAFWDILAITVLIILISGKW